MNKYVKTPLNYTGNKFRLLDQMQLFFPNDINIMVDLFCGGATVGLNTNCKEVYFIDNDPMVIGLLKFLTKQTFEIIIANLENLIKMYGLSNTFRNGTNFYKKQIIETNSNNGLKNYNSKGFYKLRNDYNLTENKQSDEAYLKLYLLLLYGFNNDLRFNAKGEFNLPIGKTDFNSTNVQKLKTFLLKIKSIKAHYICANFDTKKVKDIIAKADFVYMDPPYLITNATYNESNKWNNLCEHRLLNFMNELLNNNKKFILSNVISKKTKMNEPLYYWTQKNINAINIQHLKYSYSSSSYNKIVREGHEDEIIIVSKVKNENK